MKNRNTTAIRWIIILFTILILSTILLYRLYHHSEKDNDQMLTELSAFRSQEKQSALLQSVSRQMEEIAYQQKEISETRRQEAVWQTEKANRMQHQAETEREKAIYAQTEAEKAYRMADGQKMLAMEKQQQAEHSKRVADTLAFLALGRSLGTLSVTQYQSGNTELAALLAYAAWNFTQNYGGDVFHPAIFNALSRSCRQSLSWFQHRGAITAIIPINRTDEKTKEIRFITCSKYGELLLWKCDHAQHCTSTTLLSNPQYDFRNLYSSPDGLVYALSYEGNLIAAPLPGIKAISLPDNGLRWLIPSGNNHLWIISNHAVYTVDCKSNSIQTTDTLNTAITCAGKLNEHIYLFFHDGQIGTYANPESSIQYAAEQLNGYTVTAFCTLPAASFAVGCKDGTILLCRANGAIIEKLIGHRASVTALCFKEDKLFSGSYDGTLRMWNIDNGKTESAVIWEHTGWIHALYLHPDRKYIFMGDEQGGLYRIPVSPGHMADAIRNQLSRDLTREEWSYYIGSQIPYESYCHK